MTILSPSAILPSVPLPADCLWWNSIAADDDVKTVKEREIFQVDFQLAGEVYDDGGGTEVASELRLKIFNTSKMNNSKISNTVTAQIPNARDRDPPRVENKSKY